jgi:hypothetical protein
MFVLCCVVDWERTSLKPYVDMLDRHAMGLMEEVRRSKIEKIGALGQEFLLPCITLPMGTLQIRLGKI